MVKVFHDGENAAIPTYEKADIIPERLVNALGEIGIHEPVEYVVVIGQPKRFKRSDTKYFKNLNHEALLPHTIEYKPIFGDKQLVDNDINGRLETIINERRIYNPNPEKETIVVISGDKDYFQNLTILKKELNLRVLLVKSSDTSDLYHYFTTSCTWTSLLSHQETDWCDWVLKRDLYFSEFFRHWYDPATECYGWSDQWYKYDTVSNEYKKVFNYRSMG